MILITVAGIGGYRTRNSISNNAETRIKAAGNPIMAEIFVYPLGNDSAEGSVSTPLLPLVAAQKLVRNMTSSIVGDIIVYLRGGDYFLEKCLVFNQSDGGSGIYNVIYRN
jgi:hypothetical protein